MKARNAYIQGAGRLEFKTLSPSGLGRQVLIPFYLESQADNFQSLTTSGLQNTSLTSPNILITPTGNGATNTALLRTPQISWSVLRMVGFVTNLYTPPIPSAATLDVCFSDLKVGGSTSLFVHEDFANASIYSTKNDSFSGLRDYPLVKSPNVAQVAVALFQNSGGAAPSAANSYANQATQVVFSCNLVCEILQDDNYGSHIPGPYARKGAMVRRG